MSAEQVYALPGAKESYERQQQQLAAQAQTGAGQDGADGEEKVRASHLLIKHSESRRPASWKNVRILCSRMRRLD
jgi:NIMA-interacting peptidyl-prolyl cis-trans isomerase 1